MKILVTGSNGLLGQKLIHLWDKGRSFDLIATSRGENRVSEVKGFTYASLDITNAFEVDAVLTKFKPDAVINTAAMTHVDECEEKQEQCTDLNVNAVQYLVESCTKNDVFFLHLSTDFIFDGLEGPYSEEAEANPLSFYGKSKLLAEQIVKSSALNWAIARTVLVYGITEGMSRSNIILWVKNSLEAGKELQLVNDQWRTPTLAEDLAIGCLKICQQRAEGVFNISGKDLLNPYQMAMQTVDFFGLDGRLVTETDGSKFTQKAKRPPKTGFDITKARTILSYEPRSFREGIEILSQQIKQYET